MGPIRTSKATSKSNLALNKVKRLDMMLMKGEIQLPSSPRLVKMTHTMVPMMQKRLSRMPLIFLSRRIITYAQVSVCLSLIIGAMQ